MEDFYAEANAAWPRELTAITREEARRAAAKLMRHFVGQRSTGGQWVRRCWIARTPPFGSLNRGWRRLVHDVSHRAFELTTKNTRPHGGAHAKLELAMIQYVVAEGWLTGLSRVRRLPTPTTPALRLARVLVAVKRWETKRKRAENAIKKLRHRVRYYERRMTA